MDMKKIFTLLLFAVTCVVSHAASFVWGYCDDGANSYPNTTAVNTYSAAVCMDETTTTALAGSEIKSLKMRFMHDVTDVSIFVTENLNDLSGAKVVGSLTEGWHECNLAQAVKIEAGKKLYLGYVCTGSMPVGYSDVWNANGCWTKDGNGLWTDRAALGQYAVNSLCIQAVITNDNFLTDLSLESIDDVTARPRIEFNVTGKVKNMTPTVVNNYELTVKLDGNVLSTQTVTCALSNVNDTHEFEIEVPGVEEALKSKLEVEITAVNGKADAASGNNKLTCIFKNYKKNYTRNVVVEEGTGTWCQYCIRGLVGMEYMAEKYPDRFIGIGVHSSDAYAVSAYNGLIYALGGLPNCKQNRVDKFDPSKELLEENFNNCSNRSEAQVTLRGAVYDVDNQTVTAYAYGRVAYNVHSDADYRIVFVVTEDDIPAMQTNGYSGGRLGEMDGYENQPSPCYVELPDVARAIAPTYLGKKGSMPSVLTSDTDYEYSATFTLPDDTGESSKLTLIALLLDGTTGEVLNGAKMPMDTAVTAIEGAPVVEKTAKTGIYDLSGRKLAKIQRGVMIMDGKKVLK